MNYRHAYHAGNFADVLKHAVLALVIEHLKQKAAAFRVIDVHAGRGVYDLASVEAQKTGEWRDGIGRLFNVELPPEIAEILAPYLDAVRGANGAGPIARYPGSPLIARKLMRRSDTLVVNEMHPEDAGALQAQFAGDRQTKVMTLDAWTALKALLPPKERRGAVLIDPPFEEPGEFARLSAGLDDFARRFASGTLILWYPIKDQKEITSFRQEIANKGLAKILAAELLVRPARTPPVFSGSGLIILNPPFTLARKLECLLPFFAERLAQGPGSSFRLEWLAGERTCSSP